MFCSDVYTFGRDKMKETLFLKNVGMLFAFGQESLLITIRTLTLFLMFVLSYCRLMLTTVGQLITESS